MTGLPIPALPLYLSVLLAVTEPAGTFESPTDQIRRLFDDYLLTDGSPETDEEGRIRLDGWELDGEVQAELARRWPLIRTETLPEYADFDGFRRRFRQLFGFDVTGVDYDEAIDLDVPWPPRHR